MKSNALSRDNSGRVSAIAEPDSAALLHHPSVQSVGIHVRLLDHDTRLPANETLLVQLAPREAWTIAQAILSIARERSWGFPDLSQSDRPSDPKKSN